MYLIPSKLLTCVNLYFLQAYDGMIIGEHSRDSDLDVRGKWLSIFVYAKLVQTPLSMSLLTKLPAAIYEFWSNHS